MIKNQSFPKTPVSSVIFLFLRITLVSGKPEAKRLVLSSSPEVEDFRRLDLNNHDYLIRRSMRSASGASATQANIHPDGDGEGTNDEKLASFHCNYCKKDITGRIRIKCAECSDFDLCIECFSVGAALHPHQSDHPYRVMKVLSFPLISPDWSAEEELLLLEGIEIFGMGVWADVAEHVETKTAEACFEHYTNAYLNSPYFPLPDLTHFAGKTKEELLEMAKGHRQEKKREIQQESAASSSRVGIEDSHQSGPRRLPSTTTPGGYNPKRHEFDIEYDNDAEELLVAMQFKETDEEWERELKLRTIGIYSRRVDERNRRKDFIVERGLLHPRPFERDLSEEERRICRSYDVFMHLHSKEEHEELLKCVISEHRTLKSLQELKKKQRLSEDGDRRTEIPRAGPSNPENSTSPVPLDSFDTYLTTTSAGQATLSTDLYSVTTSAANLLSESGAQGPSRQETPSVPVSSGTTSACLGAGSSLQTDFGLLSISAADLLSESEKQLCRDMGLAPNCYLKIQEDLTTQIMRGNITKKSDAYSLFQLEPTKIDKVYDVLVTKGIAPP
ncbi:UNVERIFIED_CONTAM: Transcriptional adapter ADA2b [Sesamum latifolium]|uniref:Transcriptional adapter n=1 Tax=Sesamum latifolium TaxID=2727402 RepID=A0AAW2TSE4_9LAMI